MIITREDILDNDNLVGHIVLEGLGQYPAVVESIAKNGQADVRLTIDGKELNLQAFVAHWQSQVVRMIQHEALKQVTGKFDDVRDSMQDFSDALARALNAFSQD